MVAASDPPVPSTHLRRTPAQARSAERVGRLLDATAALIGELGVERVTTGLVAERAQVSIGSVYRYFPDRIALFRALSRRNLERYVADVRTILLTGEHDEWWDAVDAAIDAFTAMYRTVPGFGALRFGDAVDEHLLDGVTTNDGVVARGLHDLLVERHGVAGGPQLLLRLELAIEIGDALIKRAFRDDPAGDAEIIGECKAVVRDYLESRMLADG